MNITYPLKRLSILMLFGLALASCADNEKDGDVIAPSPEPELEVSCVLTRINASQGRGSNAYTSEHNYVYDTEGNIVSIVREINDHTQIRTFTYDDNNRVVKEETKGATGVTGSVVYTYENGLLSKTEWFDSSNRMISYRVYTYHSDGRVSYWIDYLGYRVEKSYVSFTPQGNISTRSVYYNDNLAYELFYKDYDDKHNHEKAIKGLPYSVTTANRNNYRKLSRIVAGSPYGRHYTYEYTYNEQGLPTRKIEIDTYADERNIFDYTYQCE